MTLYRRHRPWKGGGSGSMPVLSVNGKFFRYNGEPWTGIQSSEFSLVKRYLEGEEIRPVIDERVGLGYNEFRLWLLNQSVVGFVYPEGIHPNQYPDFYERVRDLLELLGGYGIIGEVTAFTSCIPLMPNKDDQHRHWNSTQEAVRGLTNVKLELVNEYNWGHGQNSPDQSLWQMRPQGIISSSGSAVSDSWPREPYWDYGLYHANGLSEWQRKVGHNAMEIADHFHVPACANENTRPDSDNSTIHHYDAAAAAALLCASACFHSQAGKYSRLFDRNGSPSEYDCAVAWANGAKSVPLEFQAGVYGHPMELEDHVNKTVLRAYTRTLTDGRSHLVLIHY